MAAKAICARITAGTIACGLLIAFFASAAHASTITVTSVSDAANGADGVCTLREALVAANSNVASGGVAGECAAGEAAPAIDVIAFAIPGAGPHAIAPASALPAIVEPVVVDGYTQAGSAANTLPTGGSNAVLKVALDGTAAGNALPLLRFAAGSAGSELRGLAVHGARSSALHLAASVRVAGTFIGVDTTVAGGSPNASHGIEIAGAGPGMIGGTAPAERNVIAFNGGSGVRVDPAASLWRIVGNAMTGNGKGIALADGPLPLANDLLDADTGSNGGQNFPLIDSVTVAPGSVRVQGRIEGAPSRTLLLDLYGSLPPVRPANFLEGETYLGAAPAPIATDAQGKAVFDVTLPVAGSANLRVTATLTDVTGCFAAACGNTSEFSQRGVFLVLPRFGSGALPVTVSGQLFAPGSSFAFGTSAALGQSFVDARTLTGVLPALNPGTLYDVTVTYPDTTTATMAKAFVTDFLDVAAGTPFYPFVMNLAAAGVTSGCLAGQYCGANEVTRAQMALFMVRGLRGPFFVPPPATGIFADVPLGSFAVEWIEQFYSEGITSGCAGNPLRFCPESVVTRAQMAVFLLRAKHGPGYAPPACTGLFADVACAAPAHPFANWIEQLAREGITSGCAGAPLRYCPDAAVLRLQMAVFLSRAFALSQEGNVAPAVSAGADQTVTLPASASLQGGATDDGLPGLPQALTFAWSKQSGPGTVTFGSPADVATSASFSAAGVYVLRLTVSDGALSASDDVQVTVNPAPVNQAPVVNAGTDQTITLPASASLGGSATDDGLPNPPGSLTFAWSKFSGPGTVTFGNAALAATTAGFSADGVYVLRLTASDGAFSASDDVQVTVQPVGSPPVLGAPPVDPTVPTSLGESTAFLYSGPNPVQTGVAPGTIDPKRVVVLRGRVIDRAGAPRSGVVVKVQGRPQFGQTLTRADGRYDLAVNGGEVLTLDFAKAGLLPVQRTQGTPWRRYVNVADVVMIGVDAAATAIAAGGATMQVHQGSVQTDASGSRRATLLFPAGTGATLQLPGGGTQPLTSLTVRATEYTVGPSGPAAMPGVLPPTSGYTYAVELSVDEAIAAGARSVQFSQPVPVYVDNFLGFPAGTIVPAGWYDREQARWVAAPNGKVIKLVAISGGAADLDIDGDDVPDDPATQLAPLGITFAERQQLASLYTPGQSFWRTPTVHFSPFDYNWPYAPPAGAKGAGTEGATTDESIDQCLDEAAGSIIECQNQILGQSVGIVGTPYTLNYRSDRVPGREIARTIDVALSGVQMPPDVKRIEVSLDIAGQAIRQTYAPAAGQRAKFVWDGKDAYGRAVQGRQSFVGSLDYVYDGVYTTPGTALGAAWAQFGGTPIATNEARAEFTFPQSLSGRIGILDARGYGVGGWTLSHHHVYDPDGETLFHGTGKRIAAGPIPLILERLAGLGDNDLGEGIPALQAKLNGEGMLAYAPDGAIWFSETGSTTSRIRRLAPDGTVRTVAGTGQSGFAGDGGLATQALLANPAGIAFAPDGSVVFVDSGNQRVRRIDAAGFITTIAGNGVAAFAGDGGPALQASFRFSRRSGIAIGADGTVFVFDVSNDRIRRIGTDGIVTTIAGGGACCEVPDGIPATSGWLFSPRGGLAIDASGVLYATMHLHLVRIGLDGIATIIAGTSTTQLGDGGPARNASIRDPLGVAVGPDGAVYVSHEREPSSSRPRVRRISAGGIITTVAGGGNDSYNDPAVDFVPAKQASLSTPVGVAMAPDGKLVVGEGRQIYRARPPLPDFLAAAINVASADGTLLYQFDLFGRHLRTRHALTGAVLHEFGYDAAGRLTSITEKTGGTDNVTTIQRDGNGQPTAIVGPYGQTTSLGVDANGFVNAITSPASETHAATFDAGGLMQSFAKPGRPASTYQFDTEGRLTRADDPAGGFQTIARTALATGHEVTRTTALGRATKYTVDNLPTGEQKLTTREPDATQFATDLLGDGTQKLQDADGSVSTTMLGADPRFGMTAPVMATGSVVLPSGLTRNSVGTRSAVLSVPGDVLSLTTVKDTYAVNGRTTMATYTAATRANVVTSPVGRVRTTIHDVLGRVATTQVAGLSPTTFTYDARGRLQTVVRGTVPAARSLTLSYDAAGNVQSVVDGTGRTVQYARDANGRPTAKTFVGVGTVAMTYDAAGLLASVTPPGRPAHSLSYDANGRIAAVTPPVVPGSGPTTFAYDADGGLASVNRPGETVTFAYDVAGRLTSIATTQPSLPAQEVAFAYDAAGRIATLTGPGAQAVSNAWNGPLLTSVTWSGPFASSVSWTYDTSFRPVSETIPGAGTLTYTWDNDDLPIGVGGLSIARDAQNGLPTGATLGSLAETYGYNAFGELASRTLTASGAPVYAATYVRDSTGRIVQKQETIAGVTDIYDYSYDPMGQLVQVKRNTVVSESYGYDANGNRLTATLGSTANATFDDQDRLLTLGSTTYAHSAAGKLQAKSTSGGTTTYRYDALGNLIDATLPSGTTVAYTLDGWDRRVQRRVNGTVVAQYVRSGDRILAELDGAGTLVSRFGYVSGEVPAIMIRGGVTYRLITDTNGSVRMVVDAISGAVAQRIDYDAFGRIVLDTNPGFQPFGFAGGHFDPLTGLTRLGARDYDAEAGRWTTRDPIGFAGADTNFYRYARNDPVNLTDPSGLITLDDVVNFAAGATEAGMAAVTMNDPSMLLAIAADNVARAVSSVAGYPVSGPSLWEQRTQVDAYAPYEGLDRSSDAYLAGELATGAALVCVAGGTELAERLSEAARRRAFNRMADELARDVAEAPTRRAAKAAAEAALAKLKDYANNIRATWSGWRTGGGGGRGFGRGG